LHTGVKKLDYIVLPSVIDGLGERRHFVVRKFSEIVGRTSSPIDQRIARRPGIEVAGTGALKLSKDKTRNSRKVRQGKVTYTVNRLLGHRGGKRMKLKVLFLLIYTSSFFFKF